MLATGTLLGPYRIVAPLGAGGMGEVYRAHDSRLGRDVAIKVLPARSLLSPDARARFEREARTISQLSHPHICTLFDVGREGETEFLVMELLEGETLAHRIARGPLPVADVLRLGAEIASALDRAHAAGVVHRDLKPGNVMLTKTGAKLMDFGLARVGAAPASASGTALSVSPTMTQPLTSEGAIVGTFQYMAPEQLEGHEADARADIWALGCVLYEMATGRHAFAGESQASLIAAIMTGEPRPIAELQPLTPPALGHVVARCLAKDPADRWQSARDVMHALEMARSASGAVAPGTVGPARSRVGAGQVVTAFFVGAVLVAALSILLVQRAHLMDPGRVHYTRLTLQRGFVQNARFSADGKSVFYSASWDGGPPEVFETRAGSLTSRPIGVRQAALLAVSSNGTMAVLMNQRMATWWHRGTVATVPASGGAPRPVADDALEASWTPDGRSLAITHRVGDRIRLELPRGHVIYETTGDITAPRISRDGTRIAFVANTFSATADARGRVVVVDTTGRLIARTLEWNNPVGVAWSADGREVWYCGTQDNVATDLRALAMDGSERVVARLEDLWTLHDVGPDGQVLLARTPRVTGLRGSSSTTGAERELSWYDYSVAWGFSADGRSLIFTEDGLFGGPLYAVCMRGMDGSPPVRLGTGNSPSPSPDGRWVLVVNLCQPQRLVLLPTGVGDSTFLARGGIESYDATGWLPDGKRIVFTGSERGHGPRTYVQDLAGGLPRPVTVEGVAGTRVSPDGRFLAAVSADRRLFVCPLAGGAPRFVTTLPFDERLLQYAADGRSVYTGDTGPSARVYRVDLATGSRTLWRTFSIPDSTGLRITYPHISPDGNTYAYTYFRDLADLYLVTGLK
jgi:eukaryotic-like serine/threonine-protein kinase